MVARLLIALSGLLIAAPIAAQEQELSVRWMMTAEEYRAAGLHKLTDAEVKSLDAWLVRYAAAMTLGAETKAKAADRVPSPPVRAAARPTDDDTLIRLEGARLVAEDGYLGVITSNCFSSEAICNEFGTYGSEVSAKSITNQFGQYGGEFSSKSPFNRFTSTPPQILKGGSVIGYLTRNTSMSPRVDPAWLLAILKR